jgi:uncharacterized delta-60 repeat protein
MNARRLTSLALTLVALIPDFSTLPAWPVPTLDPNFKPAITRDGGFLSSIAVQSDGKVIVAGGFNAINGVARDGLARLNADGSVDVSFDPGTGVCCGSGIGPSDLGGSVSALAIQKDGKIILGGSFSTIQGVSRKGLARLNTDGTLDDTFEPGSGVGVGPASSGPSPVSTVVLQPDGKLLVGGSFTSVNGVARNGLARLHPNGSVDTSFDPGSGLYDTPGVAGRAAVLALLGDGRILVGGSFQLLDDSGRNGIGRLNPDGSRDDTFVPYLLRLGPGGLPPASVDGMVVQTDGRIVISGLFDTIDAETRNGLARLKVDGSVDLAYNPEIDIASGETFTVLCLQADDKLIALRRFNDDTGEPRVALARLNTDGSLDRTFSTVFLEAGEARRLQVSGFAAQPGGKWLVAGALSAGTVPIHRAIARLNANGDLDDSFNPRLEVAEGSTSHVLAVAIQKDGNVLVGGTFARVDGSVRNRLARLKRDGSLDSAFAPFIEVGDLPGFVSSILVQDDGKILIGGLFTSINGASRNSLARLNEDGSLDNSFNIGSGTSAIDALGQVSISRVSALALQPDGKVLVAGDFTQLNGVPVSWLARLHSDGSVDTKFAPSLGPCWDCAPPDIRWVAVTGDTNIFISGLFTRVEIYVVNGLARLYSNGSADAWFNSPIRADEEVSAMALGNDDKVVVAVARADPAGGPDQGRLVCIKADGTLDPDFNAEAVVSDGSSPTPISTLRFDPAGRLIIGGQFVSVGSTPRRGLARFNPDGSLDQNFDAGTGFAKGIFDDPRNLRARVTCLGVQDDGGIIVGGDFAVVNNQVRLGLARFQAEQPGSRPVIRSWARAADGSFAMTISGEAGRTYRVQGSRDLRTWSDLGTVTGAATPQPFTDVGAKSLPSRFYRVVAP